MKISTKGRYGLRAMVDLAVHYNGEQITLSSIAERQNVSENYLEQMFSVLRKSGLVKSIKGAQGGYVLADNPSNIKVGMVLRALEGKFAVIDEGTEALNNKNNSIRYCIKINVWDRINEGINSVIDAVTLEDMANEYNKIQGKSELMYYI